MNHHGRYKETFQYVQNVYIIRSIQEIEVEKTALRPSTTNWIQLNNNIVQDNKSLKFIHIYSYTYNKQVLFSNYNVSSSLHVSLGFNDHMFNAIHVDVICCYWIWNAYLIRFVYVMCCVCVCISVKE